MSSRGAANDGVRHWLMQRVTSLALIPLAIWFVMSLIALPLGNHAVLINWMTRDLHALLLLTFALVAARHSHLGVQVVIEDYVHSRELNTFALILNTVLHLACAAAVAFAVLKIAL